MSKTLKHAHYVYCVLSECLLLEVHTKPSGTTWTLGHICQKTGSLQVCIGKAKLRNNYYQLVVLVMSSLNTRPFSSLTAIACDRKIQGCIETYKAPLKHNNVMKAEHHFVHTLQKRNCKLVHTSKE